MGKQYFCDYCLKGFPDNRSSREKHLRSNQHKIAYKDYYTSCTDPLTIHCLIPKSVRNDIFYAEFFRFLNVYHIHIYSLIYGIPKDAMAV